MIFKLDLGFLEIAAMIGAGFYLLTIAADWLVHGASNLAKRIGVSSLVIGLTVVAFGTSMPELVVSIDASLAGNPGIAVGNVVGSNIFNIALILGIAALINPITCSRSVIRRDVPIMITVAGLMWYLSADRMISRMEAGFLFSLLITYTVFSYVKGRQELPLDGAEENDSDAPTTLAFEMRLVITGLIAMIAGSKLLLHGSVAVAKVVGISDEVIGLTLIAAGTSLPELATSVVAALRGKPDIAIGNVVGSNIFNILGILGLGGIILPLEVSEHMGTIDCPVMFAVSLACLPIMYTGLKITRFEAAIFLVVYVSYTLVLFQTPG
ncbi:MAG: calcium/sodium antiporter [Candidatus Riflebacteria bacterium]|nr:calcium/sodium antiporter [Candidatus Riflebacteria bacterium]